MRHTNNKRIKFARDAWPCIIQRDVKDEAKRKVDRLSSISGFSEEALLTMPISDIWADIKQVE